MNWGWDKDKHYTWYNQWDFKTPRTYRERYGVNYKRDNDYEEENFTQKVFIMIVCVFVIGYGVIQWMA
ncbi:hypothetical protein EB001_07040 [bacterium]|nr:hypothetical protein [bacterium]